jgi:NADPH-dependent curcumin reductase CurA
LKTKETVYVGIEKMRDAFYTIFSGEGIGKQIIKAVNEQTHYP